MKDFHLIESLIDLVEQFFLIPNIYKGKIFTIGKVYYHSWVLTCILRVPLNYSNTLDLVSKLELIYSFKVWLNFF